MIGSSLFVLLATAASALAQSTLPIVNTPTSLITCQPASISFSGGTAPYYLSVLPGGETGAAARYESFPTQTAAGSYVWTVNLAAGLSVTLTIRDSLGQLNYAQAVTIQAGPDTACVGVSISSAASSTAVAATTTTRAVTTSAVAAVPTTTVAAVTTTTTTVPSTSSVTTAPSSAPTTTTSHAASSSTAAGSSSSAVTTTKPAAAVKLGSASVFALGAAAIVALFA